MGSNLYSASPKWLLFKWMWLYGAWTGRLSTFCMQRMSVSLYPFAPLSIRSNHVPIMSSALESQAIDIHLNGFGARKVIYLKIRGTTIIIPLSPTMQRKFQISPHSARGCISIIERRRKRKWEWRWFRIDLEANIAKNEWKENDAVSHKISCKRKLDALNKKLNIFLRTLKEVRENWLSWPSTDWFEILSGFLEMRLIM